MRPGFCCGDGGHFALGMDGKVAETQVVELQVGLDWESSWRVLWLL